ncbi:peptidase A4 family-domain-containing protein [Xylariaceae sp. FL1272]|nr:peptidase A4 family-domain-containing protein [Xylariaceae sp. FL1272]
MRSVITATLLAGMAVASPMMEKAKLELQARNAARRSNTFKSSVDGALGDPTASDATSTNWGGIAIVASGVSEVAGTFVVPGISPPGGAVGGTSYCGAAWVGVDGYTNSALIQTGVLWCIDGSGSGAEYQAWYEYLPAGLVDYGNIAISAGDSVTVTATMTGSNQGTTTLSANGQVVSHDFSGEGTALQGASAEWIVEDFSSNGGLVPFANFGSVTFTDATAIINGATFNAADDNPVNIGLQTSSGAIITDTSVSGSSLTVTYAGP